MPELTCEMWAEMHLDIPNIFIIFCLTCLKLQAICYPFRSSRVMTRDKQERHVEATSQCKRAKN